ncbi:DUF1304 domain-containing protein [Alysiella filiformis]|uniref:Putative membrane protein n=1 Tax=Alysiella filiformis DSM 16848 TaxID=1120981 RepID=A0A286ES24_9NEIS|nr:DUF1304 domain-containing protein [Alysiella filiformis]QMT31971.1 DUF1304 domain-containing protein [Alysiella filiformis]UBQ57121.1 DUF1304 domain-containing protein [Alysiella filiformis DSM 16848]SOD73732.1 putative membrane protein [Alysiella filiformis DSM 16848]
MLLALATLFALAAAIVHGYIFYLEVVAFGTQAFRKTFHTQPEHEPFLRAPFNNLGVYNLALAVFTILGVAFRLSAHSPYGQGFALGLMMCALGTMAVAGAYLFVTAADKRVPALVQMVPAILGLICLGFA